MRESEDFFAFPAVLTFALHLFMVSSKTNYYSTVTVLIFPATWPGLTWKKFSKKRRWQEGEEATRCVARAAQRTPHSPPRHHQAAFGSWVLSISPAQRFSPPTAAPAAWSAVRAPSWFPSILTSLLLLSPYYNQNDNFEPHIWFYHCF